MNKNTGALKSYSIQVNERAHLFNDAAKPACNIIIKFAYPVKSSDDMLKDRLNAYFISACVGDQYIGEKPENVRDMPVSIPAPRNVITVNLLTFIIFILLLIYC